MAEEQPTGVANRRADRRKGPDFILKLLSIFGLVGWSLMLIALILMDKARPETEAYRLSRDLYEQVGVEYSIRRVWDAGLVDTIFYMMIAGLAISVTGLIINARRRRRRTDSYRINLMLMGLISITGIIVYLV